MNNKKLLIIALALVAVVGIGVASYTFLNDSSEEGEVELDGSDVEYNITQISDTAYTIKIGQPVDKIKVQVGDGEPLVRENTTQMQLNFRDEPTEATVSIVIDGKETTIGTI